MKITRVEAIPFAIPYTHPLRFASGEVRVAEHILVRVHGEDGVVGVAEAPPRPFTYGETQDSIRSIVEKVFAPQIVGLDILDREKVHTLLNRTVGNPCAKAAVDMALWDVIGKVLGQPVTKLLGGYTDHMRVSHMVGFDTPAKMVDVVAQHKERYGITTYKVKVGRRPFTLDVDVVRALREHFGDTIELYIDGNRGWTASEAARALRAMADLDLTLAEELNPADDVLGRRWLVQQSPVPFVADESASRPGEVTRELLGGSATAVSIKTARTGFTYSQRVYFECESLGVENVMGNQIDGQVGTMCTVVFGAAYRGTSARAGELSNFLDMSDDLLTEPLQISAGTLAVRDRPGTGVDIDEDKLAHYRQDTDATLTI
ncbi:mandelate racemase/muconate lactonizing enzyme family protein [Georgenia sp. SYP-B2076]|uniref:mandelate racemase/muconate lactonizing enzyme family protein n=1 Tax=Georgenia sp. SYP-B2076 TaxID=2495881 RepID=UPI000F8D624F|nr:enolase C-terminal domain-like protein [Georgenia sp. SYP-B2076]